MSHKSEWAKAPLKIVQTMIRFLGLGLGLRLSFGLGAHFLLLPTLVCAQFKYWNPKDIATIPKTLSEMGIYADIASPNKVMHSSLIPYEVNAPLWSDDAKKRRWILVPEGKQIEFELKNDVWKYPDSTVFIKQFSIDTIPGDSTSSILWETRILINKKEIVDTVTLRIDDVWYSTTYKWNADQADAKLVDIKAGLNDSLRIYPQGLDHPFKWKRWRFPSKSECNRCHQVLGAPSDFAHGRSVLAFFTAQLNRPSAQSSALNQIQTFFNRGIFKGANPLDWNGDSIPRWAGLTQTSASIDQRARSYLAANCSGCHGRRGIGLGATQGSTLNFDFHTQKAEMDLRYRPTIFGWGRDTIAPFFYSPSSDPVANPQHLENLAIRPGVVIPGYPEKSVLWHRMQSRNTIDTGRARFLGHLDQMPPLGSYEIDLAAKTLIMQWILEMAPLDRTPLSTRPKPLKFSGLKSPTIIGRILYLPADLPNQGNIKVALKTVKGRTIALKALGRQSYMIPLTLKAGLYIIQVNGQGYIRQIL